MKYLVFETNGSGVERYSRTEEIEADTTIQAVTVYESTFNLRPQTTHLMVTSEGKSAGVVLFVKEATSQATKPAEKTKYTTGSIPGVSDNSKKESSSEINETRRHAYSVGLFFVGSLNFVFGALGLLLIGGGNESERRLGFEMGPVCVGAGLTCFAFAYIIQLLFECRNYLRKIAEK